LPDYVNHHLIYANQNPDVVKLSENSDGVVPLSSQLHSAAETQSSGQFGFNSCHTSILVDDELISYILGRLKGVNNVYPEDHLQYCFLGGYEVELSDDYNPLDKHIIHNYGKYWMAVTKGVLKPFFEDQDFFVKLALLLSLSGITLCPGMTRKCLNYPAYIALEILEFYFQ